MSTRRLHPEGARLAVAAAEALHASGQEVTHLTVAEELKRRGQLGRVGGVARLVALVHPGESWLESLNRVAGTGQAGSLPPSRPRDGKAEGLPGRLGKAGKARGKLGESLREYLERTRDLPPISWLVEGVLPGTGQAWIIAKAGAGKTWLCFIVVKTAAAEGRTVFVVEEEHSERGLRDRFVAMAMPDETLDRVRVLHRLGLKVGDQHFEALVREVADAHKPVVVFDCLAQVLSGKENDADAAALFNDCIKRLVVANPEALVMVLHHTSKGSERAEESVAYAGRGSSAFNGAADVELRLRPLASEKGRGVLRFSLETTKAREFEAGEPRHVTLTLGTGEVTIEAVAKVLPDRSDQVLEVLRESDAPLTKDAVSLRVRRRRDDVGKLVDELVRQGKARRDGKGFVAVDAPARRPDRDTEDDEEDA